MDEDILSRKIFIIFLFLLSIFFGNGFAWSDPVEIGVNALERKHYATALRAWLPAAKNGNPRAQNNVGFAYEKGLGVSQSYTLAIEWYRKAASSDLAEAQHNLGMIYFNGYGVEKNYKES